MAQFLWSESSSDLPSDAAWVNVANRSQFAKSGLSMKAQALTPCIQSFCSALDSKLKARLDDLLSYLPAESSPTKELTPPVQPRSSFDRYADTSMVEGLLRDHCIACIHHVLSCVREELQGAQADVPSDTRLHAVLFMARLCQSLSELCPHLKQCILGRSGSVETALKETRSTKKLGKGKVQEVNPVQAKWQEVKAELLQQSLAAYQIWSSAVTKVRNCFSHHSCFLWGFTGSAPCDWCCCSLADRDGTRWDASLGRLRGVREDSLSAGEGCLSMFTLTRVL